MPAGGVTPPQNDFNVVAKPLSGVQAEAEASPKPMKNTSLLVLLGNAKRTPAEGAHGVKIGSVPRLRRNWGL